MFKVEELLIATGGRGVAGEKERLIKGVSIDSRTLKAGEVFIAIKGENYDGHHYIGQAIKKGAGAVIFEARNFRPGSESRVPFIAVGDSVRALGDLARFNRQRFPVPVIAVTGSVGKTTTKEMIAWALSKRLKVLKNPGTKNNQIGLPLALLGLNRTHECAVLEIGTNHFGEVGYLAGICQPNIAVLTNIGSSHLEYFKSLEGVLREKYVLVTKLKAPKLALFNLDDPFLRKKGRKRSLGMTVGFGIEKPGEFYASDIQRIPRGFKFTVNRKFRFTLKTLGVYNIYNALAAIACGRIFGLGYVDLVSRLATFGFLQNRLQLVKSKNINFINDAYNSNPLSLKQALRALSDYEAKGRKIFVMGDMLELGRDEALFHRSIGEEAARVCDVLITVGPLSKGAARAAARVGLGEKNIFVCENNLAARKILFKNVVPKPEDIVLIKGSRAMKLEEILKQ